MSLVPIVQKVGDILLWLLDNMLLPISKWAIEQAIPAVLELISAGFSTLNSVLDALKPLAIWLWEDFLQPFGEWTGSVIIAAIKGIAGTLKLVSDWINNNQEKVRYMTELVLAFFAAWKIAEFVSNVSKMIAILSEGGLAGVLLQLTSRLNMTKLGFIANVAAIAALVAAAYEIYKNWGAMTPTEKVISGLLAAASAASMLAVALGAATGPAGAAIRAAAIAAAIGAALIAINAGSRATTSGVSSGGSRSFAASSPYAAYSSNIPHLATGTVVPPKAGNFLAMLGDNNKDYEVVSPLGTMKQAFKEVLDESGGMGSNRPINIIMEVEGNKFAQLVYKYNNQETQRIGVRMVTNGG